MHYEQTIKSVLLYQNQNTYFAIFIQGDINNTLYTCIVIANCLKTYFANYQFYIVVNQVREGIENIKNKIQNS